MFFVTHASTVTNWKHILADLPNANLYVASEGDTSGLDYLLHLNPNFYLNIDLKTTFNHMVNADQWTGGTSAERRCLHP